MNKLAKPAKHAAPGQYLGYGLQLVRLCYHLLTCAPGAKVSLEYLDDVAIHDLDGSVILEQTKSALSQNPISDWAIDFWKALSNWLNMLDDGVIQGHQTTFRIYVTPCRAGSFSTAFNRATTESEISAIIKSIAERYGRAKQPLGCEKYLQTFLKAAPERQHCVIRNLSVESLHKDPVEPIRDRLATTIHPSHISILCGSAIGQAKQAADRLIQEGKIPILDGDEFKVKFRAFVQRNVMSNILPPTGPPPNEAQVTSALAGRPLFIRQLELIGIPGDVKMHAVSDFLRASADKTGWAALGLIYEDSLQEWDSDLIKRYRSIRGDVNDQFTDRSDEVLGRMVYRRCSQLEPSLEGKIVPNHFVHGCFNNLADLLHVEWHPNAVHLLKEGGL